MVAGGVVGAVALHLAPCAGAAGLSMDDAVRVAFSRNRDLIAAKLDVDTATTDVIAARMLPNPVVSYTLSNLVLGRGNDQMMGLKPGFFDQPVQTIGISQVIDVWAKRRARTQTAELGVEFRKWVAADAMRNIAHAVRTAFIEVLREQAERALAREVAGRYAATTKLSRSRFAAGDISEAELRKVELEAIRYDNAVIDADSQWDLARAQLAILMGLADAAAIPTELPDDFALVVPGENLSAADAATQLVGLAMRRRPDVRAAQLDRARAAAQLVSARREAYPDIAIGPTYSHSGFTVSGDNPNVLGVGVSLPLPLFDRNQASRARADVDIRRADNEAARLELVVRHEIADATRRERRARQLVGIYEGGMLKLADDALRTAERLYHAGASSLLEFLEAQRTYLETRGQYLRTRHELRQASVDVAYVVAEGDMRP
jgi:cobalt-zinc-cadmium efflux system outer membrane protein